MDLAWRTETFAVDDHSWLGSRHGMDAARSVTLDTSSFTAATHYPNGFFPSGLPLGRITASGLYGPYDAAATDGRETFGGFLAFRVPTPKSAPDADVVGAMLEHGRVIVANLPVEFEAPEGVDRIIFA